MSKSNDSVSTSVLIEGEDVSDADTYTNGEVSGITSRPTTDANASWDVNAWSVNENGADTRTPDIASIVEEIVARGDWSSGNAMAFVFTPSSGDREMWKYRGDASKAAVLHIEYTDAPVYTLTVNSGTGDGDYEAGTVVNIVANAPPGGMVFDQWTGNISGVDFVNNADANITMPADPATVTATYVVPDTDPSSITAWHSAGVHGRGVGEALLEILDDGSFSEPRSDGIGKLIVTFDEAMDPVSFFPASVEIAGTDANGDPVDLTGVTIGTSLRNGDTEGVITFSPALPNYAMYLASVIGVTDIASNGLSGDNDRIVTALTGDASGDLRVNVTDYSLVRGARTKLIGAGNVSEVRCDASCDGRVNTADMSQIRPHVGNDATAITDPVIP